MAPVIVVGIYLLLGVFIYTSVNKEDTVKVVEKEQRVADDDAEVHPVRTYLIIDNGYFEKEYYARLEDTDNFMTMLGYHRENSGLSYEKSEYSYGLVLDNINGMEAPYGYEWKVYDQDTEITYNLVGHRLEHEHTYTIRLEEK